jgi:hypothetical protein
MPSVALVEDQQITTLDRGTISAFSVVVDDVIMGYDLSSRRPVWVTVTGVEVFGEGSAYSLSAQGLAASLFSGEAKLQTDQGRKPLFENPFVLLTPCAVNMRNILRRQVTTNTQIANLPYIVIQFDGADCIISGGYLLALL